MLYSPRFWPALGYFSRRAFPGNTLIRRRRRLQMMWGGLRLRPQVAEILDAPRDSALQRLLSERPQMLGCLVWPYQNAGWPPSVRLARLVSHCRELDAIGDPFPFGVTEQLVLADLDALHAGLRVVLEQPGWFMREGGLTLSLFVGDFRAYSLAFSLFRDGSGPRTAYIGAIQGRNQDEALQLYRDLTHALFGIRPRDFVLECLRLMAPHLGIMRIEAVCNSARHHNHPYFAEKGVDRQDYDPIWLDRGGWRLDGQDSFELPTGSRRRPLAEIKANKRSMYRRRYAFLDDLEGMLAHAVRPGAGSARPPSAVQEQGAIADTGMQGLRLA